MHKNCSIILCMLIISYQTQCQSDSWDLQGTVLKIDEIEHILNRETNSADSVSPEKKECTLWHHTFPLIGLRAKEPHYPFIPHYFGLWDLAPHKGKGITVAAIDTGVAAFALKNNLQYPCHPALTMNFSERCNFNIVGSEGEKSNPYWEIVELLKNNSKPELYHEDFVQRELARWIYDYVHHKRMTAFVEYIQKYGISDVVETACNITEDGNRLLKKIEKLLAGFTVQKVHPSGVSAIEQFLPLATINTQDCHISGHGSHIFGLIAAQESTGDGQKNSVCGLAPEAQTLMIKAVKSSGKSSKQSLIRALRCAQQHNADIVNLSLKMADTITIGDNKIQKIEQMLSKFSFVVAASGNEGNPKSASYAGTSISYPARFDCVAFDVGAYSYKQGICTIPEFCQYEVGVGPKVLAPGYNILSTGLDSQIPAYIFMHGTSVAAALISGFLALLLGEFKGQFSKEQLLKVCYFCTLHAHDDSDWHSKVLLGALDMRYALFMLHALLAFKKYAQVHKLPFDLTLYFDQAVKAVGHILLNPVEQYGRDELGGVSFKKSFVDFLKAAETNTTKFDSWLQKKLFPRPSSTLDQVLQFVTRTLWRSWSVARSSLTSIELEVHDILIQEQGSLFEELHESARNRIYKAFLEGSV